MSIRFRILFFFSSVSILLIGTAFIFIYTLFSEYREEEFQQRQKEKITTTLKFLTQTKEIDRDILEAIDRTTIHDIRNEKLLIFNKEKKLIYSSLDDTPIPFSNQILLNLSPKVNLIEQKDGIYDVVGISMNNSNKTYYGISQAYDTFGYSKLSYLKHILVFTFMGISISIILTSFYLSKKITQPIIDITEKINHYDLNAVYIPIEIKPSKDEITILAKQFNQLMKQLNDVFSFQKHTIHHISHELKTPIAILVSNFERIEKETDIQKIKLFIDDQKKDTKNLSEIINALLEISKAETKGMLSKSKIRIDELIFDIADELHNLYPDFQFLIEYTETEDENMLYLQANVRLLKSALMNILSNAIQYSTDNRGKINISNRNRNLIITVENKGKIITDKEKQYLFQHFFRGENSRGQRGFGLGLVFSHKILTLHHGSISYTYSLPDSNTFTLTLPLS